MISELNRFFSSRSLASTYKPTFLKCLLDLGDYREDEGSQWISESGDSLIVDLNFVAARFLRYYWPLHFKFKLKQEATASPIVIYRILDEYQSRIGVKSTPSKNLMCSEQFKELRLKTIRTSGFKDQVLKKLLNDCKIYSISKGSASIVIKREIVEYMKNNKKILEAALNHVIAEYLEKINSSPNISRKLEERIPRTTLKKDEFAKIIAMEKSCFYCGKKDEEYAQEHFIPWNFIFDTQNFNIVAACNQCNSSKNDKLPDSTYLKKILDRNASLEKVQYGYSSEYFKNLYDSCLREYHGIGQKLWKAR